MIDGGDGEHMQDEDHEERSTDTNTRHIGAHSGVLICCSSGCGMQSTFASRFGVKHSIMRAGWLVSFNLDWLIHNNDVLVVFC